MAYDDEALYVAVHCHEPDVDKIKDDLTRNSIYYNDSIEIFIDHLSEVWLYHQFVFDTKLRTLQALTIANRAAYSAGANPELLFNVNIELVKGMIGLSSKKRLLTLAKSVVAEFISLVPDRDLRK